MDPRFRRILWRKRLQAQEQCAVRDSPRESHVASSDATKPMKVDPKAKKYHLPYIP